MKKKRKFISGIDVSKKTFDITVGLNEPSASGTKACFANNQKGYGKLSGWLKDQKINYTELLVCLENTGIYHQLLARYLQNQKAFVWVETPVQIKWSGGIQRGKSDAVDSERIMRYAYRNQDQASNLKVRDKALQQVADYLSLRVRLQKCIKSLIMPVKELKSVGLITESKALEKASKLSIQTMQKELKALDQKIMDVIEKDEDLAAQYKLVTSVRCVGFVAAIYFMVYTDNFTRFETSKQLAAFAGIAPLEYSSGTSIKGRTKVHPMANKQLKTAIHMCALSSIRHNPEMKTYFDRKVEQGKNKMLVLNAVRNKIVARVFSCVKNQRMYTDTYAA